MPDCPRFQHPLCETARVEGCPGADECAARCRAALETEEVREAERVADEWIAAFRARLAVMGLPLFRWREHA